MPAAIDDHPNGGRRLRVLVSAYACEPNAGSEPGVGWHMAHALAARHDVWVLTRGNNRAAIEAAGSGAAVGARPRFTYFDLPSWARWLKRRGGGIQVYYYLWQLASARPLRRLASELQVDVVHHLTFGRYWSPSGLAGSGRPFVWGPLGGGESAPTSFRTGMGARGRRYEMLRDGARKIAESDPFVRATARTATVTLASTAETADRLRRLGVDEVRLQTQMGVDSKSAPEPRVLRGEGGPRFVTLARLLHWKGIHLAVRAFADAGLPTAEYRVVGDGPEAARLRALAESLGVADQVRFMGSVPRHSAMEELAQADALIHPSLHDQAPAAVLEALASGTPVVCLRLGGPALQVDETVGIPVDADDPESTVRGLSLAMRRLAEDDALRQRLGAAALARASADFSWQGVADAVSRAYVHAVRIHAHENGNVHRGSVREP